MGKIGAYRLRHLLIPVLVVLCLGLTNAGIAPDINVLNPAGDGNYLSGTQSIDFNVVDANITSNADGDLNAFIYYSSTSGALSNLIVDLNLFAAGVCNDTNFGNGAKCTYAWDTTVVPDGNYFIDINIAEFDASDDIQDSDVNSSARSFAVDNTLNAPTITSPADGSSTALRSITLSYTSSEGSIKKYWVRWADNPWVDNGTNTSYTFSSLPEGTFTLSVKVQNMLDQNGSATSITVHTIKSGGGPVCGDDSCNGNETAATCPRDCPAVCGDGACTHTESKTTCPADCGPAVVCGDGTCEGDETYSNCPQDCEAPPPECTLDVDCSVGYECMNGSCVEIPPPPECTSDGDCMAGYECRNGSCVEEGGPPPECTSNAQCDDANPCTDDLCTVGECSRVLVSDGTTCGFGKECSAGVCKEAGTGPVIPPGEMDLGLLAVGVIVIAAIIGAAYYYFIMPKK